MILKFKKDDKFNSYKLAMDDIQKRIDMFKEKNDTANVEFFEKELARFEGYYQESISDSPETTE